MDSKLDFKALWNDELKRKKIIAIGSIAVVCMVGLSFYYGGEEQEDVQLTEIPMTEAQEVKDYNNKLQAVNDTITPKNYLNKDLESFFSDNAREKSSYDDEERKADSLSKVFDMENSGKISTLNASNYTYNSPRPTNQSSIPQEQANEYRSPDKQSNIVKTAYNVPNVKTEEQILEDKRNALRGNSSSSGVEKRAISITAVIRGTQSKKANEELVLKTTQDMFVAGLTVPKNTYLYGRLQFSNNRALANVSSVNVKGKIQAVNIELYGLDGNKGIPIQNATMDKAGDVLIGEAENVINKAGTAGRIVTAVGNTFKSGKEKEVTFIDNQAVILYIR